MTFGCCRGSMSSLPVSVMDASSSGDTETIFIHLVMNSLLRRCSNVCLSPGVTCFLCLTGKVEVPTSCSVAIYAGFSIAIESLKLLNSRLTIIFSILAFFCSGCIAAYFCLLFVFTSGFFVDSLVVFLCS
uniref:Uncharacterized protein n=1 Tax=Triticum urartu TaxID=4572 RepID=A0A8R7URS8_TRIUA